LTVGRKGSSLLFAVAIFLPILLSCFFLCPESEAKDNELPDRLFASTYAPQQLASNTSRGHDGKFITPPSEEAYFPTNFDGQPYVVNIDTTVNLTRAINQFYYNPKWRGEVWTPFDQVDSIERQTRLMSTWREYDEFSELRVLNGVNKWFEKWSGFGP
jgi:hypothetical protein